METTLPILSLSVAAAASAAAAFPKLKARLALSRAKHHSLAGHSKMSRRVAKLLPFYEFEGDAYFACDGAPANVATQRKDAFFRLASLYAERYPKGRAGDAVGQQEVEVFLLGERGDEGFDCHESVSSQY